MITTWEHPEGKRPTRQKTRRGAKKRPLWQRLRHAIKDTRETGALLLALDAHGVGRELLDDLAAQDHPVAHRLRQAHAQWAISTVKGLQALAYGDQGEGASRDGRGRIKGKPFPNNLQWLLEQHAPRDYHERRQTSGADSAAVQVLQELRGAIQDARSSHTNGQQNAHRLPEPTVVEKKPSNRRRAREGESNET